MQQAFDAISAVLVTMAHTPAVQGREFVGLGIQCNNARDALRAALAKPARPYHETHEAPHCPTCDCGEAKPAAVPEPKKYEGRDVWCRAFSDGWNDCREAMLAAAPQPPAPAVDVEAVRVVLSWLRADTELADLANQLARAIGDGA